MANHGDIKDNTAGYRSEGIYFISKTPQQFKLLIPDSQLDPYCNLPELFRIIEEFHPRHWDLDKMITIDHDITAVPRTS